ncbi:MAG: acyl-CoA thioesterase [Candidatus Kariarchaeaceae archaeon]|jgi:acyl-CoA thioester hydrolase
MGSSSFTIDIRTRFRDTDAVGHVNNAVFLSYLEAARAEWYTTVRGSAEPTMFNFILARMEIDYLAPIHFGSTISVKMWVSHIGNKSWSFSYQILDEKNTYAKATSIQVAYDYENEQSLVLSEFIREQLMTLYQSSTN